MSAPSRRRHRLLASAAAGLALLTAAALPGRSAPQATGPIPLERVTVQAILDGPDLWIDRRRARVQDNAQAPEQLRTGASRAQLGLPTAAAIRMNRSSQLRLGSRCFLMERGQILMSGPVTLCTRSVRLSVRGTHVLVDLDALGGATISMLEGQAELASLTAPDTPSTLLRQGSRLRLDPDGRVLSVTSLSEADYRAFVEGPLVDGFSTPLPQQPLLQQALSGVAPGLSLVCAARPEPALAAAVNTMRQQQGLPDLQPLPKQLAERNCRYLAPVLRHILSSDACDHNRDRWQALVEEHGEGSGLGPMSELIACPAASPLRPGEVVRLWMQSALHRDLLLRRPRATAINCMGMTQAGRTAAICTTWRGTGRARIRS